MTHIGLALTTNLDAFLPSGSLITYEKRRFVSEMTNDEARSAERTIEELRSTVTMQSMILESILLLVRFVATDNVALEWLFARRSVRSAARRDLYAASERVERRRESGESAWTERNGIRSGFWRDVGSVVVTGIGIRRASVVGSGRREE